MLGWCQFFLVVAIAWAAVSVDAWLPHWPVYPAFNPYPWLNFQLDLARCLWAVLPAACLWGASFPLALAAAAPRHQDSGRMVGAVYAANTLGAIVGAVAFSVILIPAFGTLWAQRILIAAAAAAALVILLARLRAMLAARRRAMPPPGRRVPLVAVMGAVVAVPAAAAVLAYDIEGCRSGRKA